MSARARHPLRLLLVLLALAAAAAARDYERGAEVPFYANVVGPYANPSEKYPYFNLPFCPLTETSHRHLTLGEVIDANSDVQINALYDVRFLEPVSAKQVCVQELDEREMDEFRLAVHHNYYFNLILDELPIWGFVGSELPHWVLSETPEQTLYNHLHFSIGYNGANIVEVNVTAEGVPLPATGGASVPFLYSVEWVPSDVLFAERMERYLVMSFFDGNEDMQWLSVLNSAVLAVLLVFFLASLVTRALRADIARYSRALDEDDDEEDESGWKQVRWDVFRAPTHPRLLAAVVGTGSQLLCAMLLCMLLVALEIIYPYSRGGLYSAGSAVFALTTVVNGYVTISMLRKHGGSAEDWVSTVFLSLALLIGPLFVVWSVLNSIAIAYGSVQAFPAGTVVVIIVIVLVVVFPLLIVGASLARRLAAPFEPPCRVKVVPRGIPPQSSLRVNGQLLVAGLLPFSAIYVEVYYLFNSIWGHGVYRLYGLLLVAFLLLLIVNSCIAVTFTYLQLNSEDYHWWWQSVGNGGAPAVFLVGYAIYYFVALSDMYGFMQTVFFFGYVCIAAYFFFLMLATVGFTSSLWFVKFMYRSIKQE